MNDQKKVTPLAGRPETQIAMTRIMTPDMANFTGSVHGGDLLSFFDKVAYVCAKQYARCELVTLSVDQVFFKKSIKVGELVTCNASVNYVGKTSMEVGIRVTANDLSTGNIRHTNSCFLTMVAVDEKGRPKAISPFKPETHTEKRRYDSALLRKQMRLKMYGKPLKK